MNSTAKVFDTDTVVDLITRRMGSGNDDPKQLLVGLIGPSGSHKTVAAKHLRKAHGFSRLHAGEPIKSAIRKGFRLKKKQTARGAKDQPTMALGGATPRAVMEAMGTGIHTVAPTATSHVMAKRITKRLAKGKSVVVDGIRTQEEADTLRRMGGMLCRVNSGKGPNARLPMDMRQASIKADHELDSSGTKADLKAACDGMLQRWGMPKAAVV